MILIHVFLLVGYGLTISCLSSANVLEDGRGLCPVVCARGGLHLIVRDARGLRLLGGRSRRLLVRDARGGRWRGGRLLVRYARGDHVLVRDAHGLRFLICDAQGLRRLLVRDACGLRRVLVRMRAQLQHGLD